VGVDCPPPGVVTAAQRRNRAGELVGGGAHGSRVLDVECEPVEVRRCLLGPRDLGP
jgi:hypothetical protein